MEICVLLKLAACARLRAVVTSPGPRPQGSFHTTHWTHVRQAKADSHEGRRALADLCDVYYEPVVAFLNCELRDADAARETSHAFFEKMLADGTIGGADHEKGRFRSYLLGAVKHFLSHQREAAHRRKRGGGVAPVSLDDDVSAMDAVADARQTPPDAAFDRQWALTVLAQALAAVRNQCTSEGRLEFFNQVKPWLTGEAAHGDQAAIAETLGMSPAALKMAVHRLKRRFRECVKSEIAATLDDPASVGEEMQALFDALAG